VGKIAIAAGDSLGVFYFEVEVLGGPVGDVGMVKMGQQLSAPGVQGAPEQDKRGGCGIPSRRQACLGAGQGQVSRWSTARDERPGHLPLVCYAFSADVMGYPRYVVTHTHLSSLGTIPER
jgi:hypothetical protein